MRWVVIIGAGIFFHGCAAKKPALAIPRECITRIELTKPCDPKPDGIHAICVYEVTYSCVKAR
jgi:hypothetical protein